jgi:Protein of unknown function (DUF3352)
MKSRLLPAAPVAAALVAFAAGCGGGSGGSDPATLVPPGSPVYIEADLRPSGELEASSDAVAEKITGVNNLGDFIVEKLESNARDEGEPFDFEEEVEPWLGEKGALFFEKLEGDDRSPSALIVESTDPEATWKFIDAQFKKSGDLYHRISHAGVEYEYGGSGDNNAAGVVGDFLVFAEGSTIAVSQRIFEDVVDAYKGESLADEDTFAEAISAASDGSLADVYVDIGKLIDQSGGQIDPTARQLLRNAGIDPSEATAVASVVPGEDQVAIELSSDLGGQEAPTGDASALLGSLPGDAFAGIAVSGFGNQVKEALDKLDEEGIPGTVPPGQLKKGLKELGIDLEGFADSLEDGGVFAVGTNEGNLGGALVLTTKGSKAVATVASIVTLLRSAHVKGVSVLGGKYSGFSIHSSDLGEKPLVVVAKEGRVAIGYGLPAALSGLTSDSGSARTLSDDPAYDDAVSSLGATPISGFADGPAALRLADSLISGSDEGFEEAKKYLKSISFLALGSATQGDLATAKLIVGLK